MPKEVGGASPTFPEWAVVTVVGGKCLKRHAGAPSVFTETVDQTSSSTRPSWRVVGHQSRIGRSTGGPRLSGNSEGTHKPQQKTAQSRAKG